MAPRPYPPARSAPMVLAALSLLGVLSGCGAEVAGTAAAVGQLQATQASQAQAAQAKVIEGFKQAQEAGAQRNADAASAAQ